MAMFKRYWFFAKHHMTLTCAQTPKRIGDHARQTFNIIIIFFISPFIVLVRDEEPDSASRAHLKEGGQ